MDTARPFAGIEVVKFGQFIAVPFCAQVLSEGGAHVIKVESANSMLHDLTHPALGRIRVLAPPLAMNGGGFVPATATSAFGSETRAILGDLGLSDADVEALLAEGATRDGLKPRG